MVVRLRFAVHGPRHGRIFHLVAINGPQRRNAKPIETLGVYKPAITPESPYKLMEWSVDRIKYWLRVGAQPSDSVVKLLTVGRILPPDSPWHSKPTLKMTQMDPSLTAQPSPSPSGTQPEHS